MCGTPPSCPLQKSRRRNGVTGRGEHRRFINYQHRDNRVFNWKGSAMTQAQLERAVCRATGESRDVVRRVGFQLVLTPRIVLTPRNPSTRHAQQKKLIEAGK